MPEIEWDELVIYSNTEDSNIGKQTSTHGKHFIVVPDDPEDGIEVIHEGCTQLYDEWSRSWYYDCAVEFEIQNSGLTTFFDHIANKEEAFAWHDPEYLQPGTYQIEWWQEVHNHWEYGPEYSTGLCLVEREEDSD